MMIVFVVDGVRLRSHDGLSLPKVPKVVDTRKA